MAIMSGVAADADGHLHGFGTRGYRSYALNILLLVFILNFIDRSLLSVVAPQMKPELGISDTAFGLLTGFGFALLYTIVGIPLAQYSETRNRVAIIAVREPPRGYTDPPGTLRRDRPARA